MMRSGETYLGDGLYVSFQGSTIWLRAPRAGGDHEVALEPHVFKAFLEYVAEVAKEKAARYDH